MVLTMNDMLMQRSVLKTSVVGAGALAFGLPVQSVLARTEPAILRVTQRRIRVPDLTAQPGLADVREMASLA